MTVRADPWESWDDYHDAEGMQSLLSLQNKDQYDPDSFFEEREDDEIVTYAQTDLPSGNRVTVEVERKPWVAQVLSDVGRGVVKGSAEGLRQTGIFARETLTGVETPQEVKDATIPGTDIGLPDVPSIQDAFRWLFEQSDKVDREKLSQDVGGIVELLAPDVANVHADYMEWVKEAYEHPLMGPIVQHGAQFATPAIPAALAIRAMTSANPFLRGLGWGGIADLVGFAPNEELIAQSIVEGLLGENPESYPEIAQAAMRIIAKHGDQPTLDRAKLSGEGMLVGALTEGAMRGALWPVKKLAGLAALTLVAARLFRRELGETAEVGQSVANLAPEGLDVAVKPPALPERTAGPELDDLGFYSTALESAKDLPQGVGTASQMLAMLKKAGVRDEELAWTGLDDYLKEKEGKVTQEEIIDYLRKNRVQIEETEGVAVEAGAGRIAYDVELEWSEGEVPLPTGEDVAAVGDSGIVWRTAEDERSGTFYTIESFSGSGEDLVVYRHSLHGEPRLLGGFSNTSIARRDQPPLTPEELLHEAKEVAANDAVEIGYGVPFVSRYSEYTSTAKDPVEVVALSGNELLPMGVEEGTYRELLFRFDPGDHEFYESPHFSQREGRFVETSQFEQGKPQEYHTWEVGDYPTNILAWTRITGLPKKDGGSGTLWVEELQSDWHKQEKIEGVYVRPDYNQDASEEIAELNQVLKELQSSYYSLERAREYAEHLGDLSGGLSHREPTRRNIELRNDAYARYKVQQGEHQELEARRYELQKTISDKTEGDVPDAPYKTMDERGWPQLVLRRLFRYATENGYDEIRWTTGQTQSARYDAPKDLYDKTLPKIAKKIIKKFDPEARIDIVETDLGGRPIPPDRRQRMGTAEAEPYRLRTWYRVKITPEMSASIKRLGQAIMGVPVAVGAATAASEQ